MYDYLMLPLNTDRIGFMSDSTRYDLLTCLACR
jgi:hypothetical protein